MGKYTPISNSFFNGTNNFLDALNLKLGDIVYIQLSTHKKNICWYNYIEYRPGNFAFQKACFGINIQYKAGRDMYLNAHKIAHHKTIP